MAGWVCMVFSFAGAGFKGEGRIATQRCGLFFI
jgi:hypothetical protein